MKRSPLVPPEEPTPPSYREAKEALDHLSKQLKEIYASASKPLMEAQKGLAARAEQEGDQ